MVDTIIINEDIVKKIQKANVEMEAKRGVIAFMISSGTSLDDENYKNYEKSYIEAFKEFESLKKEFEDTVVKSKHPSVSNWSLNYNNNELTVNYTND